MLSDFLRILRLFAAKQTVGKTTDYSVSPRFMTRMLVFSANVRTNGGILTAFSPAHGKQAADP